MKCALTALDAPGGIAVPARSGALRTARVRGALYEDQKAYDVLENLAMRLRIVVTESKTWRWAERIALAMLGLAILLSITGIVITGSRRPASRLTTSAVPAGNPPHHEASQPATSPPKHTVTAPEQNAEASVATARVVQSVPLPPRGAGEPRRGAGGPNRGIRLRGRGSVVILAVAEADAAELLRHPNRLGDLIQSGSVFSVPNGTAAAIAETHAGLAQVHVLDGAFQGRDGWVRADQVARK
jgi:hypothetical protein